MTRVHAAQVVALALVLTAAAGAQQEPETFYLLIQRNRLSPPETRERLAKGANPNMAGVHSVYPDTPLVAAVRNDNLAVARVLVEAGANLNPSNAAASDPPLHVALSRSDDIFLFLLSKGATPDQPDRFGRPPLYWAALDPQHYDKAVMLLNAGARLHGLTEDGQTFLQLAAAGRNTRLAELLVRKGVDVNARDPRGYTALMSARSLRLARLLIDRGATITDSELSRVPPGPIRDFLTAKSAVKKTP
jgi:ankyrin repeat protein